MWIKICGNTNLDDAQHAAASGADALGFVFAPSRRRVSVAQVRAIVPHLPAGMETYGVFVDATAQEIVRTVLDCGLTGVQLHGAAHQDQAAQTDLAAELRRHFAAHHAESTRILSVVAYEPGIEEHLPTTARDADAVLVDARPPAGAPAGGTGTSFDWSAARALFQQTKGKTRMIVAGGLRPENVEEAIHMLAPWGVDVVTGVEATPGRKDAKRVEAFIRAARNAASHLSGTRAAGQAAQHMEYAAPANQ